MGNCQTINPVDTSTAVISPIELLKIIKFLTRIIEYFLLGIVRELSVTKFQHSEPSSNLKHLSVLL